ncbi:hypothetical protein C8F01DRAFT_575966 [Mycena amicta]|nr:hypothetical protein C8F01DRAFT_575966 [Mycena amicta]
MFSIVISRTTSNLHQPMAIIDDKPPARDTPPAYNNEFEHIDDKVVLSPSTPPLAAVPPAQPSSSPNKAPLSEAEWKAKLEALEKKIQKYNKKQRQSHETAILASMRDLAQSHPDAEVQSYWAARADELEKAPEADKLIILKKVARAMAIIVAAPLAIVGLLLIGTGTVVKASGDFISGGAFSRKKSKAPVSS